LAKKRLFGVLLAVFACFILVTGAGEDKKQDQEEKKDAFENILMVDPAIDSEQPFCYLAKPNTCLSVMGSPHGTQVCFDGSLYTGAAELCFFYGDAYKPLFARQRQFLEGWIPIVTYSWNEGAIRYSLEAFAATLDGNPLSPLINFVKITVENRGDKKAEAFLASAMRFSGQDHRFERMKPYGFSPEWIYEMKQDCLIRDEKVILFFEQGGKKEAVFDAAYTKPFSGKEFYITDRAEAGVVKYSPSLSPRQSRAFIFKFPYTPILQTEKKEIKAIRNADYALHREKTILWWKNRLSKGAQLILPEEKALNAHRANLAYTWQAIIQEENGWKQCVNKFQYKWFWLRDAAYIIHSHDIWGHHDIAENTLAIYPGYQDEEGLFSSQKGQLDGFGQALYALGQHALLTGDTKYAEKIFKRFPPAIGWLKKARAKDPFRLIPKTEARDNELIIGHYTGHNFWALLGIRTAARVANMIGKNREAQTFLSEYDDMKNAFMEKLEEVCGKDRAIPPGLDAEGGQDWGNLIGVFPAEALEPSDARVASTIKKMHKEKFEEGLMTYKGRLHHYLTVKEAQNHVMLGQQEQALRDFYAILAHTGSAHEMFEWTAAPWGNRDVGGNFTPHGWGGAMFNILLRNMLILERGGNGGVDFRDIHLFSVISPAWAVPGKEIVLKNAPTELGKVSVSLKFTNEGAELSLEKKFRKKPRWIVFHIPYFVKLKSYQSDLKKSTMEKDMILFDPEVSRVSLKWDWKKVEPLSYAKAVEDYKAEYARRYKAYRKAGAEPLPVWALPRLTREERQREFKSLYDPAVLGIARGKPVTTSGPHEADHKPELAVDGNARDRNTSSWWAAPPAPKWLKVDLEKVCRIGAVHVFPYWDGSRFYRYTVEVSKDDKTWTQVADMSKNTKPSTARGDYHEIAPVEARYVQVTMLYNSANTSVHLVELKVFEAE